MTARIRKGKGGYTVQIGLNPANLVCKPGARKGTYLVCTWVTKDAARDWARRMGCREE